MFGNEKYIHHLSRKKKKRWRLIVLIAGLSVLVTALIFLFPLRRVFGSLSGGEKDQGITRLWNNKNYDEIITTYETKLKKNPLNPLYLAYAGFSYFYKSKTDSDEKEDLLSKSIFLLRKSRLLKKIYLKGEIDYILGLAYFLKGKYYYNLSIKYMMLSLANNYKGIDTYRCLGLAYGGIGDAEKELEYFLKALEQEETAYALLSVGEAYMKKNNYEKAEEYFQRSLNKTDDNNVAEQSRFKLGEIYMERKEYLKAEEQYLEILAINKKSANAHFYLGEVYDKLNDKVKARAEWRETLKIDPTHYGAKLRYYK
jgi:tetratricopeptide (TPR) repeat protein